MDDEVYILPSIPFEYSPVIATLLLLLSSHFSISHLSFDLRCNLLKCTQHSSLRDLHHISILRPLISEIMFQSFFHNSYPSIILRQMSLRLQEGHMQILVFRCTDIIYTSVASILLYTYHYAYLQTRNQPIITCYVQ